MAGIIKKARMGRIKGVNVLQGPPDKPATALSTSGALRMHDSPRPKSRGITRLFSGSKRSGGGRVHGAASEPNTILTGIVDKNSG